MCSTATSRTHSGSKIDPRAIDPAHPPLEAIAIAFAILYYGLSSIPKIFATLDSVATVDVISAPLFEDSMSKFTLAYTRLGLAIIGLATSFYRCNKKGHVTVVPYVKRSKLVKRPINLDGIRSQIMFTQWCWNCLTLSLFINGFITLHSAHQEDNQGSVSPLPNALTSFLLQPNMLRVAILLFEIAAPTSMLVSTITKYALWPQSLKSPVGSANLRKPVALLQHNLNIVTSLLEVGVLGRIPVRLNDIAITLVYGCIYVIFMWSIKRRLVDTTEPQFIYFFFDTTLGKKWSISVIFVLLTILITFFILFTLIDDILAFVNGGLWTNFVVIGAFSSLFCRFKD